MNISDLTGIQDFTALTAIHLGNNNLTSLDLTQNTALDDIQFGGNQIDSIDLSQNIALKMLYCDNNSFYNQPLANSAR